METSALLCILQFPRKKFVDRDSIGEKLEYQPGDSNILFYTFLKLMFYLKKQYNWVMNYGSFLGFCLYFSLLK